MSQRPVAGIALRQFYLLLATLPPWMRVVGELMPASWAFEGMRAALAGQGLQATGLMWGLGLASLYLAAAAFTFVAVFRHVVCSGLLARCRAESVG